MSPYHKCEIDTSPKSVKSLSIRELDWTVLRHRIEDFLRGQDLSIPYYSPELGLVYNWWIWTGPGRIGRCLEGRTPQIWCFGAKIRKLETQDAKLDAQNSKFS